MTSSCELPRKLGVSTTSRKSFTTGANSQLQPRAIRHQRCTPTSRAGERFRNIATESASTPSWSHFHFSAPTAFAEFSRITRSSASLFRPAEPRDACGESNAVSSSMPCNRSLKNQRTKILNLSLLLTLRLHQKPSERLNVLLATNFTSHGSMASSISRKRSTLDECTPRATCCCSSTMTLKSFPLTS